MRGSWGVEGVEFGEYRGGVGGADAVKDFGVLATAGFWRVRVGQPRGRSGPDDIAIGTSETAIGSQLHTAGPSMRPSRSGRYYRIVQLSSSVPQNDCSASDQKGLP